MKVKELIEVLKKCDPNADVDFAFEQDNPFDGTSVSEVVEIRYPGADTDSIAVIRG